MFWLGLQNLSDLIDILDHFVDVLAVQRSEREMKAQWFLVHGQLPFSLFHFDLDVVHRVSGVSEGNDTDVRLAHNFVSEFSEFLGHSDGC